MDSPAWLEENFLGYGVDSLDPGVGRPSGACPTWTTPARELPAIAEEELDDVRVVVLEEARLRVRHLPIIE